MHGPWIRSVTKNFFTTRVYTKKDYAVQPFSSTARRKYVPSYQNESACKNKSFPRAKLAR
jgi:hypothetical protein